MALALGALLIASTLVQQTPSPQALPFSDKAWTITGDRAAVVKDGARDVLQVESGFAHRRDIRFDDGTIEFEVQLTDRRSFVYLYFRVEADGEREEFYLRPHKSNLPDAVQYAPVWQGRSAWQLHHGPGGTAAAPLVAGAWTRVRVVVQGSHAALFVSDMTTPALLVPRMAREPRPGSLAVGAFLPAGVPGEGPVARFANVTISPGVVPFDFKAAIAKASEGKAAPAAPGAGVVRAWSVSRAFVPKPSEPPTLPAADVTGAFQRLETEPGGLLELHRHVRMPEKSGVAAAVARVQVRAAQAGVYAFDLGYSDIATVFVNGRPVFQGDQSYSFDRPRREGLIGFDQARLYLALNAGDNEIAVLVSDSFGGWGVMGRFGDGRTLEIR